MAAGIERRMEEFKEEFLEVGRTFSVYDFGRIRFNHPPGFTDVIVTESGLQIKGYNEVFSDIDETTVYEYWVEGQRRITQAIMDQKRLENAGY